MAWTKTQTIPINGVEGELTYLNLRWAHDSHCLVLGFGPLPPQAGYPYVICGYSVQLELLWTIPLMQLNGWAGSQGNLYVQSGNVLMKYDEGELAAKTKTPVWAYDLETRRLWTREKNRLDDLPQATAVGAAGFSAPVVIDRYPESNWIFVLTDQHLWVFLDGQTTIEELEFCDLPSSPATLQLHGYYKEPDALLYYLTGDFSRPSYVPITMKAGKAPVPGSEVQLGDFSSDWEPTLLLASLSPLELPQGGGQCYASFVPEPGASRPNAMLLVTTDPSSKNTMELVTKDWASLSGDIPSGFIRVAVNDGDVYYVYVLRGSKKTWTLEQWEVTQPETEPLSPGVWVWLDSCIAYATQMVLGQQQWDEDDAGFWSYHAALDLVAAAFLGLNTSATGSEGLPVIHDAGYPFAEAMGALYQVSKSISSVIEIMAGTPYKTTRREMAPILYEAPFNLTTAAEIIAVLHTTYTIDEVPIRAAEMAEILYNPPFNQTTPQEIIAALQPEPYNRTAAEMAPILYNPPFHQTTPAEIIAALQAPYSLTAQDMVPILYDPPFGLKAKAIAPYLYDPPFNQTTPQDIIAALQPAPCNQTGADMAPILQAPPYSLATAADLVNTLFADIPQGEGLNTPVPAPYLAQILNAYCPSAVDVVNALYDSCAIGGWLAAPILASQAYGLSEASDLVSNLQSGGIDAKQVANILSFPPFDLTKPTDIMSVLSPSYTPTFDEIPGILLASSVDPEGILDYYVKSELVTGLGQKAIDAIVAELKKTGFDGRTVSLEGKMEEYFVRGTTAHYIDSPECWGPLFSPSQAPVNMPNGAFALLKPGTVLTTADGVYQDNPPEYGQNYAVIGKVQHEVTGGNSDFGPGADALEHFGLIKPTDPLPAGTTESHQMWVPRFRKP